jgi:hypothetical protein
MSAAAVAVAIGALVVATISLAVAIVVSRTSRRAERAAREAADAAATGALRSREAVEAVERSRMDATAPRVVLTDLRLDWPPYVAAPPSDGLFSSSGSWRRLPPDEQVVLPRDSSIDLYVICRGTLRNEGLSAGRVSFTERVLVGGGDQLVETFVLDPGASAVVSFPIRRKIPAWVTEHPSARPFVRFTVTDLAGTGSVDSTMVFVDATPLRAIPGREDAYALVADEPRQLQVEVQPRRYGRAGEPRTGRPDDGGPDLRSVGPS